MIVRLIARSTIASVSLITLLPAPLSCLLLGTMASLSQASIVNVRLNGSVPPSTYYTIVDPGTSNPAVKIHQPASGIYRVWCTDGTGDPGSISYIKTDLNPLATGDVNVQVRQPSGVAGASQVGSIDLSHLNSGNDYSSIIDSHITGDLGSAVVYEDASHEGGTASITIDGNLTGELQCYKITHLEISGHVTAPSGRLVIYGAQSAAITITGDMLGMLSLYSSSRSTSNISIGGTVTAANVTITNFGGDICGAGLTEANLPNVHPDCGWTICTNPVPGRVDSDGDGTLDCADGCPNDPYKTDPGVCGCGVADTDSDDETPDCIDGCPNDPDKTEPGVCGCGVLDIDSTVS